MFADYDAPGVKGMYPNKQNPYFSGLVTQGVRKRKYYDQKCDDCGIIDGPAIED